MRKKARRLAHGAIIAALYAALTLLLAPISYGEVQFRLAEALTVLPFLNPVTGWGLFVGCVVTKNKDLQKALLKFCQSRLAVATMDQMGAAALYSVDKAYYDANRAEYIRRRDLVYGRLKAIDGVVVTKPQGAFYIMAALPVDNTHKFQNWLLTSFDDEGDTVMFAPGAPFYETPGKGINEVRIAYVLKEEDLNRAMDLLEKGIARYRKEVMGIE